MRLIYVFILLSTTVIAPAAAAELQVVCPPLVRNGMKELAAAYTRQTGIAVAVRSEVMGKIMGDIETGTLAADVVLLSPSLMDTLVKDNGMKPGTRMPVGRVEIALAVRSDAPHPDTPEAGFPKGSKTPSRTTFMEPSVIFCVASNWSV